VVALRWTEWEVGKEAQEETLGRTGQHTKRQSQRARPSSFCVRFTHHFATVKHWKEDVPTR